MNGPPGGRSAEDPGLVRRLRRTRLFATALLALMAVIFVGTTWLASPSPYLGAIRAFAEAALVGGLADWFAVTALFRRPLGLPIPHTAIVPARKNEIGRALARFIRDHFLVREAVARRLRRANLAARLAAWLDEGGNAARVSRDLGLALAWALRDDGDGGELRGALGATLRSSFDDVPVNRAVATLLEVLATGERADLIIDQLVAFGRTELEKSRVMIRVRIHEQSPWWLPKFVDQEIFDKLVGGLEELLEAMAADAAHPARAEIKTRLVAMQHALAADPALAAKSRALKDELVAHPAVRSYALELWQRLRGELAAALADETSPLAQGLSREIGALGTRLLADAKLTAELDDWFKELLLHVVDNYRDPLSEVVSETIESWDAAATSRRIELNIGTDLQYIRVNGTLVGGLVGLVLYFGTVAFS
ncbi:MAG TPA: DUF445 domain-containing protein [Gammaproteobacteria bacterium]|nr:DUF445 domain-containing protein [Gammaproteobacteria bacterium]